jgi:hypothetical protein
MSMRGIALVGALAAAALVWPPCLGAHCDGLDGPVVNAARAALESGDVAPVLVWVRPDDEADVRKLFAETLAVRKLGDQARELADRFFFETVVRVHRAGEGASFTGLKPAGRDLGPAIPAADQALERRSVDALVTLLTEAVRTGTTARFREASVTVPPGDVTAGRRHVEAYVRFIHYVEGVYEAATGNVHGHYPEPGAAAHEEHE